MNAAPLRRALLTGQLEPRAFRDAFETVPANERDAWLDALLELDGVPDDGPELPPECVAYLPCRVDAVVSVIDAVPVGRHDVFVDVGAGVGRTLALVRLLTGARCIGLEVQPALARQAQRLSQRFNLELEVITADARKGLPVRGSIYFFYCPFSGEPLERLIDQLEHQGPVSIACVDVTHAPRAWLQPRAAQGVVISSSIQGRGRSTA